jgi:hypothetical protein
MPNTFARFVVLVVCGLGATAFAQSTQGPGATLYKLGDRWVSVLPQERTVIAVVPPPAPALEPVVVPGFRPDPNYSGACHVTVNLTDRTYTVNETSSTDMVLRMQESETEVCLPTERIALDNGFQPTAR